MLNLNSKAGTEDVFKRTVEKESLHGTGNDKGVKTANLATSKVVVVVGSVFTHRKTRKYIWISFDGKA
jgi:hypothetical protein